MLAVLVFVGLRELECEGGAGLDIFGEFVAENVEDWENEIELELEALWEKDV